MHIELDRVTLLEQGGTWNTNPATYPYVLPDDLKIFAPTTDGQPLTVQQLLQLAQGQTVDGIAAPLSSWVAGLRTDGQQVVGLELSKR